MATPNPVRVCIFWFILRKKSLEVIFPPHPTRPESAVLKTWGRAYHTYHKAEHKRTVLGRPTSLSFPTVGGSAIKGVTLGDLPCTFTKREGHLHTQSGLLLGFVWYIYEKEVLLAGCRLQVVTILGCYFKAL